MKFVVCISNKSFEASLEKRKVYKVIDESKIDDGLLSIIDDSGSNYFYPLDFFIPLPESNEFEKQIESHLDS